MDIGKNKVWVQSKDMRFLELRLLMLLTLTAVFKWCNHKLVSSEDSVRNWYTFRRIGSVSWKENSLVHSFSSTKICHPATVTYLQGSWRKCSLVSPCKKDMNNKKNPNLHFEIYNTCENNLVAYKTNASPQICIQYRFHIVIIGRFPSLMSERRLTKPCKIKGKCIKKPKKKLVKT